MATGTVTLFQEFMKDAMSGVHNLSSGVLKLGIIDDTAPAAADDATPRWADYVTNEVVYTGNYTQDGETLTTVVLAIVAGICTITADDVNIGIHASGFLDGEQNADACGQVEAQGTQRPSNAFGGLLLVRAFAKPERRFQSDPEFGARR